MEASAFVHSAAQPAFSAGHGHRRSRRPGYEGRGWRGFHHHATLCIVAYGFLVSERSRIPPQRHAPDRSLRCLRYPKVTDPATPPLRLNATSRIASGRVTPHVAAMARGSTIDGRPLGGAQAGPLRQSRQSHR
jgi:hypothetical protein